MVTGGKVFRDDVGDISALRKRLNYFPCDVWLTKLAVQWGRIAEERAYVGWALPCKICPITHPSIAAWIMHHQMPGLNT